MTKTEFKKVYSTYRKAVSSFRADMDNNNYPCGYDDMLCERFNRNLKEWLDKNPVIKQVLSLLDCREGYNPVTETYSDFSYRWQWIKSDGSVEWIKRK